MKKIYIEPNMKVVKVQLCNMIAASLTGLGNEGGTATLTDEDADEGGSSWARRGSLWSDED